MPNRLDSLPVYKLVLFCLLYGQCLRLQERLLCALAVMFTLCLQRYLWRLAKICASFSVTQVAPLYSQEWRQMHGGERNLTPRVHKDARPGGGGVGWPCLFGVLREAREAKTIQNVSRFKLEDCLTCLGLIHC